MIFPLARAGESTLRKMDDHQLAHAHLQQGAGGMAQRDGVQPAVWLADSEPGRFARLDFIQNEVVDVLEGRRDNLGEAVAVFADHIHAGFKSGFLRGGQQRGRSSAELLVGRIERVEQQQVAEMKNPRLDSGQIQVVSLPQRIGPPVVEKGAAASVHLGHDIGVGSRRLAGGAQKPRVDPVLPAILQDELAQIVLAHQTGSEQWKRDA